MVRIKSAATHEGSIAVSTRLISLKSGGEQSARTARLQFAGEAASVDNLVGQSPVFTHKIVEAVHGNRLLLINMNKLTLRDSTKNPKAILNPTFARGGPSFDQPAIKLFRMLSGINNYPFG